MSVVSPLHTVLTTEPSRFLEYRGSYRVVRGHLFLTSMWTSEEEWSETKRRKSGPQFYLRSVKTQCSSQRHNLVSRIHLTLRCAQGPTSACVMGVTLCSLGMRERSICVWNVATRRYMLFTAHSHSSFPAQANPGPTRAPPPPHRRGTAPRRHALLAAPATPPPTPPSPRSSRTTTGQRPGATRHNTHSRVRV